MTFIRDPFFLHSPWAKGWEYVFVGSGGPREELVETVLWCIDQFGPPSPRWNHDGWRFNIRDEIDAMAFRIRWS